MSGINVCFKTWSHQQQEGYVFLCTKDRATGDWADQSFKWPEDRNNIAKWASGRESKDLYWCPIIFSKARRLLKNALPSRVLYADLDPINPTTVEIKPTVAWESSKNRFQALWWLSTHLGGESFENMNKALTYSMGADKGGWDITQVLRIPGTLNYKYDPPRKGKLMWAATSAYNPERFRHLKADEVQGNLEGPKSLLQLLSQYRRKIPKKVSALLQYPEERVGTGNRSDILWYLEHELIQARIPLEDIVELVRLSKWNKYKGRRDEYKRLHTEITKVWEATKDGDPTPSHDKRIAEAPEADSNSLCVVDYSGIMSSIRSRPGWLIKDLWLNRSHGMVAGEPKTFKSTITLDIAASIASGHPLWGTYDVHEQGPVLIVQNENQDWITRDRLEKISSAKGLTGTVEKESKRKLSVEFAPEIPISFINNQGFAFDDPLQLEQLESVIADQKPILTIFDPLYLMFEGELNSAKDLQPILQWLLYIRNEYKTGIMLIHHWNKNGASSRGGQRMLGSTTLHGWTESSLYMNRVDDGSGKQAGVIVEREFRAAGMMPKLDLSITMGEFGDPMYNVCIKDATTSTAVELLDLLSMYPRGLSINSICKELSLSRRATQAMIERAKDKVRVSRGNGKRSTFTVMLKEFEEDDG